MDRAFTESKVVVGFLVAMSVGLLLQLTGKILYSSGSANGSHVYILLILPSLFISLWLACTKRHFFSKDVTLFLASAVIFMAWGAVATGWGDGELSFLYLLKRALVILLYMLGIIYLMSVATTEQIKGFLLLAAVIVAIGALMSICYQFFVMEKPFGWRSFRLSSMGYRDWVDLGNPVIAGLYIGIFTLVTVALVGIEKTSSLPIVLMVFAVLVFYIFLTYSRTSWVAGALSATFLMYRFRSRSLIAMAIISVCCFILMAVVFFDDVLREITQQQFSRREETWQWALEHIGENLIFGHGYNHTFWPETHFVHAHNFYLQTAYELGFIGLVTLLAMLSTVCRSYWRNRRDLLVCLGFSMVAYILVAMLSEIDEVITRPGVYWTIFWFPLAFTMGAVNRVNLKKNTVDQLEE